MADLVVKDLHVSVEGQMILNGVDLEANIGEVNAIMGPNGSGKSSLCYAIMGHPKYVIEKGQITFLGQDITSLAPHKRAKLGLFLSFQYPAEVTGVTVSNFLRTALNTLNGTKINVMEFKKMLEGRMEALKIDKSFMRRYLNEGFSGGEMKRMEILQLAVLQPKFALLDETDSGLDIDALKVVANGINSLIGPKMGTLLVTHYQRILNYIKPDRVYVMYKGQIIKSGGKELVHLLEERGYDEIIKEAQAKSL